MGSQEKGQSTPLSYRALTLATLVGPFFFHPSLPFQPPNTRKGRRIERKRFRGLKGAVLSVDYFLLTRDIDRVPRERLTSTIRKTDFFLFLLCVPLLNKPQPTNNPPRLLAPSIYVPTKIVPRILNVTQSQKRSVPGKITPPLEQ